MKVTIVSIDIENKTVVLKSTKCRYSLKDADISLFIHLASLSLYTKLDLNLKEEDGGIVTIMEKGDYICTNKASKI